MTEPTKVTPQDYWKGFPEAPASDTFKWVDAKGFEHMTTIRSWSVSGLVTQIAELSSDVQEAGGKPHGGALPAKAQVQERDENGTPVVDPDGKPVMANLPDGTRLYTVKFVFHDQTKSGKDVLKVVTEEKPYSTKYGVSCFHPPAAYSGWKSWAVGPDYKQPPVTGALQVVIRDPQGDSKYADVIEFR
jgi:hypothetical protein